MRYALPPAGAWSRLLCLAVLFFAGCAAKTVAPPATANHGWMQDEVSDSYVFGYPLVVMTSARDVVLAGSPQAVNTLHRAKAPPAAGDDSLLLARPDIDTLSATAWLDLAAGPVVVKLPATRGHYLDARVLDMWTNVVWSTGGSGKPSAGDSKPRIVAFVAPAWDGKLAASVERVEVPGASLWLSVRAAAAAPVELAAARRLLEAVRVEPLDAFTSEDKRKRGKRTKPAARDESAEAASWRVGTPAAQALAVAKLDADAFFGRLATALRDNPPSPLDAHALAILADLGVKPGEGANLPKEAADAIEHGVADARCLIATVPFNALSANGWDWLGEGIGRYQDDYTLRAYAAYTRPGSGTRNDEVVATSTADQDGNALDGQARYVLHFPARALPPVRGWWTLTAYREDGLLVEGPVPRRSITSRDRLHRNRDGSIDIYVQATPPGRARQPNWLPAPQGAFGLVMRLYEPRPAASDGSWQPPGLMRK